SRGGAPAQTMLKAVVDHLCSKDRVPTREVLLNDLLSLMACHAAVRAGDPLTPEEIAALIAQRELADDTHHCPHGRPTALLFSRHDLDRQFPRVYAPGRGGVEEGAASAGRGPGPRGHRLRPGGREVLIPKRKRPKGLCRPGDLTATRPHRRGILAARPRTLAPAPDLL